MGVQSLCLRVCSAFTLAFIIKSLSFEILSETKVFVDDYLSINTITFERIIKLERAFGPFIKGTRIHKLKMISFKKNLQ